MRFNFQMNSERRITTETLNTWIKSFGDRNTLLSGVPCGVEPISSVHRYVFYSVSPTLQRKLRIHLECLESKTQEN